MLPTTTPKCIINDPLLLEEGETCDACVMMFNQKNPMTNPKTPADLIAMETTNTVMVRMNHRSRITQVYGAGTQCPDLEFMSFEEAFPKLDIKYVRHTENFKCCRIFPSTEVKVGKMTVIGEDKTQAPTYVMQRIYKMVYTTKV